MTPDRPSHGTPDAHLGIVELADACASMRARSLGLFETLGAWVPTEREPAFQRQLATACHRHAWHAELWTARTPSIPHTDAGRGAAVDAGAPVELGDADDSVDRRQQYRQWLHALDRDLEALERRADPLLDPSTTRTVILVRTDVKALIAELD